MNKCDFCRAGFKPDNSGICENISLGYCSSAVENMKKVIERFNYHSMTKCEFCTKSSYADDKTIRCNGGYALASKEIYCKEAINTMLQCQAEVCNQVEENE